MDIFKRLMILLGARHPGVDFIHELPLEVSVIILSKLDAGSLLNSALVCKNWLSVCKSSLHLRKKVMGYVRRRNRLLALVMPPAQTPTSLNKKKPKKSTAAIRKKLKLQRKFNTFRL
ncbi:hypothetical protein TKK_0007255 [Trichogramma kaykai]|uniref:F-box domain-containing protein n=1 Tax=Trichogramma kaykai TaxID=54128 RepID=A0ABD2XAB1_9HYME